ncbi:DUF2634 domain-containing protein [Paenibacillus sp. GYB004]|uniref:DUF2634 domain-containing protein n=1 Tax=Paenibacillus sp. GYB004 TaxID=2994393 RepID=UPI002F968345
MSLPKVAELEFRTEDVAAPAAASVVHSTLAWDFTAGDFVLKDGKTIVLQEVGYLQVWIQKALRTIRDSLIYARTGYGSEHHSLIGKNFKSSFSDSEYERMIREALLQNEAITRVDNFAFSQSGSRLDITFDVQSIYGTTQGTVAL